METNSWGGKVGKAVTIAGCIVFSIAALGSGLDRVSSKNPSLAENIPPIFAARAYVALGQKAILSKDYRRTLHYAELAIRTSPIEPENVALLGAGRLALGDSAGADKAFRVAGLLGWRVPITQLYWENRALAVGDLRVATLRLDAVLRELPAMIGYRALMDPIERDAAGRKLLAERLHSAPLWLDDYILAADAPPADVLRLRAQVLEEAAIQGTVLGCSKIAPLTRRLVLAGDVPNALQLWQAQCPSSAKGLLADLDLKAAKHDSLSPFSWELISDADLSSNLGSDNIGGLEVSSTALGTRAFMRQLVPISVGRFRLSWKMKGDPARIAIAFTCERDPKSWVSPQATPGGAYVDISSEPGCFGQWLVFGLKSGEDSISIGGLRFQAMQ